MPEIELDKSCTFGDYFKLQQESIDVIQYFGFDLKKKHLAFPQIKSLSQDFWDEVLVLKNKIRNRLEFLYFSAEIAKREVYIAPIIFLLIDWLHINTRIEYPIKVTEQLKGTLDYL